MYDYFINNQTMKRKHVLFTRTKRTTTIQWNSEWTKPQCLHYRSFNLWKYVMKHLVIPNLRYESYKTYIVHKFTVKLQIITYTETTVYYGFTIILWTPIFVNFVGTCYCCILLSWVYSRQKKIIIRMYKKQQHRNSAVIYYVLVVHLK